MNPGIRERWRQAAPGLVLAASAAAHLVATSPEPVLRDGATVAVLAASAALTAALAARVPTQRVVRFAPAFVLAALVAVPAPAALLVAGAALLASRRAVIGPASPPGPSGPAVVIAVLAVQALAAATPAVAHVSGSFGSAVRLGVLYLVLQGLAWIGGWTRPDRSRESGHAAFGHAMTREAVAVPLAWTLAFAADGPAAALPVVAGLAVLAAWATASIERVDARLRAVNDDLAARVTELATLHATGREILSSLDLRRVVTIADRECRKILDVDEFAVALADPDTSELRTAYRRQRGASPDEADAAVRTGLETRAAAERTPVRVDDLGSPLTPTPTTFRRTVGSALVVPLLVENRVVGVLAVRSDRIGAYDDHRLSFLTTIAQQAAVAIENARHYRMATRDSLTGLFLRDYFFRRVDEEHHRAERYRVPFGLLMIDLDHFKTINDEHGHPAGDRYLRAVGRTIRDHLRAADLACRYGGDEFCVLLPQTDGPGSVAIAERLRRAIAAVAPDVDGASPPRATASIGVATFPDDAEGDLAKLLRNADRALYRAKREGRDRVAAWSAPPPRSAPGRARGDGRP